MTNILTFSKFINESKLNSWDFTNFIEEIKSSKGLTMDKLKEIGLKYKVHFMSRDEFASMLSEMPPESSGIMIKGGLLFGCEKNGKISVVVNDNILKYNDNEIVLSLLEEIVRHESVHIEQMSRDKRGDKIPLVAPVGDDYFKSKMEVMAFARSSADHFINWGKNSSYEKNDIISIIKSNPNRASNISWVYKVYRKIGGETYNRFLKYLIEYLNS